MHKESNWKFEETYLEVDDMFSILSIGDPEFLEQILTAVAMITGSGDFTKCVAIGLLIGVFIIIMGAIMKPDQGIQFQIPFVAWILYMIAFYPKVDVTIEDGYTGELRVVSNVPAGIAVAGSSLSQVGYGLTELFETGYSIIVPTVAGQRPPMDTLRLTTNLLSNIDNPSNFAILDESLGGSAQLRNSIKNYIKECTMTKIQQKVTTADQIASSPFNSANGIPYRSYNYFVEINENSGPATYTCSDGWDQLSTMLQTSINSPLFRDALARTLKEGQEIQPGYDALSDTANTIEVLTGVAHSGTELVETVLFNRLWGPAASEHLRDYKDTSAALALNEALLQRDLQWSAEGSMFKTIAQPLITFLEGFFYALSPFMMFIIAVAGAKGIMIAVKFLSIAIWIQLWAPITAVVNLYTFMAANGEMLSLTQSVQPISLYAIDHIHDRTMHWMGVAGMLTSSVPVLALAVIHGGAVSMSSLAGRFQGSDNFKEDSMVRDTMKNNSYMTSGAVLDNNAFQGQTSGSGMAAISSIGLSSGFQTATSSAKELAATERQAYSQSLSDAFGQTKSAEEFNALGNSVANSIQKSDAQGFAKAEELAAKRIESAGASDVSQRAYAASLYSQAQAGVKATAGLEVPFVGGVKAEATAGAGGKLEAKDTNTASFSNELKSEYGELQKLTQSNNTSLTSGVSQVSQSQTGSKETDSHVASKIEQINEVAERANSASERYSELSSFSETGGVTTSYTDLQAADAVKDNMPALNALAMENVSRDAIQDQAQIFSGRGFDDSTADRAAKVFAIADRTNYSSNEDYADAMLQLSSILGSSNSSFSAPQESIPQYESYDNNLGSVGHTLTKPEAVNLQEQYDTSRAGLNEALEVDHVNTPGYTNTAETVLGGMQTGVANFVDGAGDALKGDFSSESAESANSKNTQAYMGDATSAGGRSPKQSFGEDATPPLEGADSDTTARNEQADTTTSVSRLPKQSFD